MKERFPIFHGFMRNTGEKERLVVAVQGAPFPCQRSVQSPTSPTPLSSARGAASEKGKPDTQGKALVCHSHSLCVKRLSLVSLLTVSGECR